MGKVRVKTTYSQEGIHGTTDVKTLYCVHNSVCDSMVFYDENGETPAMAFYEWDSGNDLFDAMLRLSNPFIKEWGGELKPNVEYFKSF